MSIHRLKAVQVKTLGAGLHNDGGGLHLAVGESGSRSWIFRYQLRGRRREMGIGPVRDVSLQKARELAAQHRQTILFERVDPLDKRRAEEAAKAVQPFERLTFQQCARQFLQLKQTGEAAWVWEYARDWEASAEKYIYPVIGKIPVAQITVQHIVNVLEPIWVKKPKLARDIRSRLGAVMEYGIARGEMDKANPAKVKALTTLLPTQPKAKNHAAMHHDDIAEFIAELRTVATPTHLLLEFLILTTVRRDEARLAQWDEFDRKKKIWTIPAERMKEREIHLVPLNDAMLAILDRMETVKRNKFVFVGGAGPQISETSLGNVIRKRRPGLTIHGFRATFRTWFSTHTSYPRELGEHCLAHAVGDATERAYNRETMLEKRRPVMQAWADHCAGKGTGDNVVPLTRQA